MAITLSPPAARDTAAPPRGHHPALPRELYIESTTRCNEHCDQCPRTHLSRELDRDISLDEVRGIVAQLPSLRRVVLHGLGEPLMNRELPVIVTYLRARGVHVLFNTNALLLNESRGQALIDAGLNELRISIDGATAATYARIRGVNHRALPHIVKNVKAFEALKRRLGEELPRTSLWFTAMRENFHELPLLVDIAADMEVQEVYVQRFIYFGKGLAQEDQTLFRRVQVEELALLREAEDRCRALGIAFRATGAATPAAYLGPGAQLVDPRPWSGCARPYTLAYITAHGNVFSCCFAPFNPGPRSEKVLGNVFNEPFEDIWTGDRYRAFRAAFESDSPWSQCAGCGSQWSL
ncbi:MAG: radical SAM protein [Chloroflexota bacterium]|nr:radical SAM protein [Chloroflexota bacterium]